MRCRCWRGCSTQRACRCLSGAPSLLKPSQPRPGRGLRTPSQTGCLHANLRASISAACMAIAVLVAYCGKQLRCGERVMRFRGHPHQIGVPLGPIAPHPRLKEALHCTTFLRRTVVCTELLPFGVQFLLGSSARVSHPARPQCDADPQTCHLQVQPKMARAVATLNGKKERKKKNVFVAGQVRQTQARHDGAAAHPAPASWRGAGVLFRSCT